MPRLIFWIAPALVAALGSAALSHVRRTAMLSEACLHLVRDDASGAAEILWPLQDSAIYGARARAGLRIAEAMGARLRKPLPAASFFDTSPFPLAVLTRRAFENGQFEAALELSELADRNGRPTVSLVRTATLIERGNLQPSHPTGSDQRRPSVRLARHVRHYIESQSRPSEPHLILRDRTGQRLGYVTKGDEIEPVSGLREEWIPRTVPELLGDSRDAVSVRLSLDLELSEIAFEAFGSYRGSIVMVDPQSGQILAAVSDRRTFKSGATPVFEQGREPASIAKLITTTAALRAGLDPDAEIARMTCNGHQRFAGKLLYCPYIAGPLRGLDRALAVSCNIAFADLAVTLGRHRIVDEFRRYGFDRPLGPFPGGRVLEPWGNDRQLADFAIGLEATEITPLHAALLAAVMANDGVMPVPTILHAEDGRLGFHPRRLPPAVGRRVLEPEWLPSLLRAMRAVVENGTASRVESSYFPVAMKTGTASDPRWGFHVNYIGIGPLPDPRIAFCVRITHQRTSKRVRVAAREVTRRLLAELGRVAQERGWRHDSSLDPNQDRIHKWAKERRGVPGKPFSLRSRSAR